MKILILLNQRKLKNLALVLLPRKHFWIVLDIKIERKDKKMKICCICGKEFEKSKWYKPFDLVCDTECFHEKLWQDREKEHIEKPFIIIDGVMYSDAGYVKNPRDSSFLGHGGRMFHIQMNDGTTISTNNLWCGGSIPEKHREILSDNASFIRN